MSTAVELPVLAQCWEPLLAKPLDEEAWNAWIAKGQASELRNDAVRWKATKWVAIVAFIATSLFWFALTPYANFLRFAFALCSLTLMFKALNLRLYSWAAVFAAMLVFYNPIIPAFSFTGDWRRLLLLPSAVPFAISLAWRNSTK